MHNIKERIIMSANYYNLSVRKFEEKCQLNRGVLGNMSEKSTLGSDKLASIFDICKEINPEWLVTGKGNMLKRNMDRDEKNTEDCTNVDRGDKYSEKDILIQSMQKTIDTQTELIIFLKRIIENPEIMESKNKTEKHIDFT